MLAVQQELGASDALGQVVDGALKDERRHQPDAGGRERTDQAERKRTSMPVDVAEQASKRGHIPSIIPDHACTVPGHSRALYRGDRLSLLQRIHRREGDGARRYAADARSFEIRRRQFLSRRSGGCSSAIISRRSPAPGRCSVPCWRRSSAGRRGSCGCSPARAWPARSTT